jgi:hypothetical protein
MGIHGAKPLIEDASAWGQKQGVIFVASGRLSRQILFQP